MKSNSVHFWLPRDDEHDLAASLGLCERDPKILRRLVEQSREQTARDHPHTDVRIHRWHVWRVVRAMHRAGALNTPDGRATAIAWLAARTLEDAGD